jgi:hypothetical protein
MANPNGIIRRVRERAHKYRLKAWLIDGHEKHSGIRLKILYAGHEKNRNYLTYIAYEPGFSEDYMGRVWTWRVQKFLNKVLEPDLVVIETEEGYYRRFSQRGDYYIPFWLDGDIGCTRFEERARLSKNIREDLRKIRKQCYQYEVTRDPEKLDLYYHEMYRPYILKAHGNRASLMSHEAMMSRAAITDLLLIKKGDEYLAGENLLHEERGVRAWSLGVRNGDYRHVREGVIGALYYYKIVYLGDRGIEKFNAGASRAFLNDGALQYKRKWGLRLTHPRPGGFWLRIPGASDGAKAFLINNPFINYRNGVLSGFVFLDDGESAGVAPDCVNYSIPGLQKLIFARFIEGQSTLIFNETSLANDPAPS